MAHFRTVEGFGTKPGFCTRGGRQWFAARGWSWADFVRHGIDADTLTATGDGLALALVDHARKTEGAGHGR